MRKVELLGATHDRSGFDCGAEPLNRYLQQIARQHIAKGLSKTFVLVDEYAAAPKPVIGFFTISLCQVLGQQVPAKWAKKLPDQIPAMARAAGGREDSAGRRKWKGFAGRGPAPDRPRG